MYPQYQQPGNDAPVRAIARRGPSRRDPVRIAGQTVAPETGRGWRGAVAAYLAQKDVGSEGSRVTYRKGLEQFFGWVESTGRRVDALTAADVLDFKDHVAEVRHCSSFTVASYVNAIRGFYEWAESEKLYPNIASGVKSRHDSEHVKMHLNRAQTRSLLQWGEASGPRNYAMINLMLRCGLRTVEVSRADIRDVSFIDGQRVLYIQGKGRRDKKRWVVVRDAAWEPIRAYLEGRRDARPAAPLFACEGKGSKGRRMSTRTIQDICKKGLRAIGLDSHLYSAHSLRHTAGVRIINNGGTVADVQEVLGHASIDTSRIYLMSANTEIRLKNPAERFLDEID